MHVLFPPGRVVGTWWLSSDLLHAGGSLALDSAKNVAAYGDVKPAQILDGTLNPPPEMQVRAVGRQPGADTCCLLLLPLLCGRLASRMQDRHQVGPQVCPEQTFGSPLQPLYSELSLIVHQAQAERPSAAPSRVSASLERYSTGECAVRFGCCCGKNGRAACAICFPLLHRLSRLCLPVRHSRCAAPHVTCLEPCACACVFLACRHRPGCSTGAQ